MASPTTNRIDLLRLGGIHAILGVDLTDACARIVELRRTGGFLRGSDTQLQAGHSLVVPFTSGMNASERGVKIRQALESAGCRCKYAVASLRSRGVRIVDTKVPVDAGDMDEWIQENTERLLRISLPGRDITFDYRVLGESGEDVRVEIGFARATDVQAHKEIAEAANLRLLGLSIGLGDARLPLQQHKAGAFEMFTMLHYDESSITILLPGQSKGFPMQKIPITASKADLVESGLIQGPYVQAGLIPPNADPSDCMSPFGLGPEFVLSAGLALRAFNPDSDALDALGNSGRERAREFILKTIAWRTAFVLGLCLVVLLVLPTFAQLLVRQKLDKATSEQLTLGPAHSEVMLLEQEVHALRSRLDGFNMAGGHSDVARLLINLVNAIPDSVWLSSLEYRTTTLSLKGQTVNSERIAKFMRLLGATPGFGQVRLVRSGSPEQNRMVNASTRDKGFVLFHISSVLSR